MKGDLINVDNKYPLISVFLASYNQAKYVIDFINGWKSQSFQDFEIIAVDNFSTDGTAELLQGYSKVRLIQEKSTAAEAWIIALNNCRGKYLVLGTTSDYICSHTWAERALLTLESDPELSLVWSSGIYISENGWFEGVYGYRFLRSPLPSKREYLAYWMTNNFIPELGCMMSARVYRECVKDFLTRQVDVTFFTIHFKYEFTARGYLQKYIPDIAFAGRTHQNQCREILYDREFALNISLKDKQKKLLKAIIFEWYDYKFYDRDGKILGGLNLWDRVFLLPKILGHTFIFYVMNLFILIFKLLRSLKGHI